MHKTRVLLAGLALIGGLALAACASPAGSAAPAAKTGNAFAQANLASFKTFTLKNGIPVVVKINPDNRIFNLRLVLKGGSALTKADNAGIESLMLNTMARGSADWPYAKLMATMDATSSGMGAAVGFDAASYSLNTLDKYFEQVFPVWADTVIRPAFAPSDFEQVKTNALEGLESVEQDPWSKLGRELNKVFFGTHPYANPSDGTPRSISGLDLAAVKAWYQSAFSANRIFVVAVGNYDLAKLKADLDRTLGTIPDLKLALPAPVAFDDPRRPGAERSNPGGLSVFDYPASKGIAYLRGDFPVPGPRDSDFAAARIAFKMFGDLLFEVVRTRHNAVYSPGASVRMFGSNYGSITIYKTGQIGPMKSYIDQALAPLLAGKCLATKATGGVHGDASGPEAAGQGPLALESIESALPIYVAQYINEAYEAQQTNAGVASLIEASLLYQDEPAAYLRDVESIKAVTPQAIQDLLRRTLVDGRVTWGLIGSADAVKPAKPEDYQDFKAALPR